MLQVSKKELRLLMLPCIPLPINLTKTYYVQTKYLLTTICPKLFFLAYTPCVYRLNMHYIGKKYMRCYFLHPLHGIPPDQ
jgi:hypothetical protein